MHLDPGPAVAAGRPPAGLRVAMALYGDISYDSRVLREAETLRQAGHAVTIYCLSGFPAYDVPFRVVAHTPAGSSVLPDGSSPFLRSAARGAVARLVARIRWMFGYARTLRRWGRWAVAAAGDVDVWHVHDLTGLMAVAPHVRPTSRVVYDSHEIFLDTGTAAKLPNPIRRLLMAYERRLVRRAHALVTVNEGCASVLQKRLRPRRAIVVRNCPPRWEPPSQPRGSLREAAGIPTDEPVILFHGALSADRGLSELALAILEPGLDRAHVVFLGYGGLRHEVEQLAAEPRFGGRLHLLAPVPSDVLLDWLTTADLDAIPYQHTNLNQYLCSPNKLFESIAAGVPVVVSDFPVMRGIVMDDPDGPLGTTCDPTQPASIATAIRAIIEAPADERAALRARCRRAAHERWNWEREGARLVELYEELGRSI